MENVAKDTSERISKILTMPNDIIDKIIDQPTDGLLYDIDLLPEQLQSTRHALWNRVIRRLHEKYIELSTIVREID